MSHYRFATIALSIIKSEKSDNRRIPLSLSLSYNSSVYNADDAEPIRCLKIIECFDDWKVKYVSDTPSRPRVVIPEKERSPFCRADKQPACDKCSWRWNAEVGPAGFSSWTTLPSRCGDFWRVNTPFVHVSPPSSLSFFSLFPAPSRPFIPLRIVGSGGQVDR